MKRLRVAEEKVALIKKLIPQLHHAIAEYHSHSQPLGDHLTGGFERSLASAGEDGPLAGSLPGDQGPDGAPDRRRPTPPRARPPRPHRRHRPRPRPSESAADDRPTPADRDPAGQRRRRPVRRPAGRRGPRLGEDRHERPVRPAPTRPEEPAGDSGTSPRRPGTIPNSRDFEKHHIIPLEQNAKHAIIGMEKLSEILGKLRAQCKED